MKNSSRFSQQLLTEKLNASERLDLLERVRLAESAVQKTTLSQYLTECHYTLSLALTMAAPSALSRGLTRIDGRLYPQRLRKWDFDCQTEHLDVIRRVCGARSLFSPTIHLSYLAKSLVYNLRDEQMVRLFDRVAVVDRVQAILDVLAADEAVRRKYKFSQLVVQDFDPRVPGSLTRSRIPDSRYVRTARDGRSRSLALIYEYKAAHKLSTTHLQVALANKNLFREVLKRWPAESSTRVDGTKTLADAENIIAMSLVQTYDYMVRAGVSYGYVSSGRAIIFLYVPPYDMGTLYCHGSIPSHDVHDARHSQQDGGFLNGGLGQTSVAKLASFCLLSLTTPVVQGDELRARLAWIESGGMSNVLESTKEEHRRIHGLKMMSSE